MDYPVILNAAKLVLEDPQNDVAVLALKSAVGSLSRVVYGGPLGIIAGPISALLPFLYSRDFVAIAYIIPGAASSTHMFCKIGWNGTGLELLGTWNGVPNDLTEVLKQEWMYNLEPSSSTITDNTG